MPAATKNLTGTDVIEAGATWFRTYKLVNSSGTAYNLTDHDFTAKFRPSYYAVDADCFSATCTVTDAANGTITVKITDADTQAYQIRDVAKQKAGLKGVYTISSQKTSTSASSIGTTNDDIRWIEGTWEMTLDANY